MNRFETLVSALRKGTFAIAVFSSLVGIITFITCFYAYGWLAALICGMGAAFILELILNVIFAIILQQKYYPEAQDEFARDIDIYTQSKGNVLHEEPGVVVSAVFGVTPEPSLIISDPSEIFPDMTLLRKPEERIGTFQDESIYEWLELKGSDGKIYRFTYHSCSDKHQTLELVPGRLVLATGIIYQVDTPINNPA